MKKLLLILTLSPIFLFSQKEYNEWVVGYKVGLSFKADDDEVEITDKFTLRESVYDTLVESQFMQPSVISNFEGSLKYYSYGSYIRSTDGMLNNEKLKGGSLKYVEEPPNEEYCVDYFWKGAAQNTILLKIQNTYLRVANHSVRGSSINSYSGNLTYSLIKDDKFIKMNETIKANYVSDALHAIKNFKTKDYWIITYNERSKSYSSYLANSEGISSNPTNEFKPIESQDKLYYGCYSIKSSPNGQYVIAVFRNLESSESKAYFDLLEFDPFTGNFIRLINRYESLIGIFAEFSGDSRFVFLGDVWNNNYQDIGLYRVDLLGELEDKIITLIERNGLMDNNGLQLAPNDKFYVCANTQNRALNDCSEHQSYIGEITLTNQPTFDLNKKIILTDYADDTKHVWNFPNIPTSAYLRVYTKSKFEVCEGEAVQLESFVVYPQADTTYSWSGPNGFTSTEQNPLLENLTPADEGVYTVTVSGGEEPYTAETFVRVFPSPEPELIARPRTFLCTGDGIFLNTKADYTSYKWTTGDTTQAIRVTNSGTYGVTVTSENGCEGYAEIKVGFAKDYEIAITGDTAKCIGETVTLTSADEYEEYEWSTGETTRSITVTLPGYYTLTVLTEEGCEVSRTIQVKDHAPVDAELLPTPTTICEGDSTLLQAKYYSPYYIFEWNTGATTRGIYASETGTYKLRITDTRTGCSDSTEIAIKVEDNLQPTITRSNICSGQSATLTALPNDPSYSYEWSNGATTPVIEVSQAGTYTVTVSKAGCTGTAETIVNESPSPEFEIQGESIICNNETATLTADKDFEEYLWSTNEITKSIEVSQAGTYTLTVTDENGCSATKSFKVEKYELNFTISKNNIDFGKVYISETKTDRATLSNNSGFAITLENGEMVQNGQIYEINYDFTPTELGFFGDDISVHIIEPCDTTVVIPITARVYARAIISTDDIYTEIGRTETVPVYLECEADLPAETYEITTDIDKSVFFTSDSYIVSQNQPINKTRTKIHELTGTVLLSDDLVYDITFPDYKFDNTYIEVTDKPGKIFIDSICIFNYRNIAFTEPTTLTATPTPATEQLNISITTGMQGTMHLELVSTDGRVIYTNEWHQTTRSKQLQLDTRAIPSGLYQLRLITPYDAVTTSVVVVE